MAETDSFTSQQPLETRIRPVPGSRPSRPVWEWSVHLRGSAAPLKQGNVTGPQYKAIQAARDAKKELLREPPASQAAIAF